MSGQCLPVQDGCTETVGFYKAGPTCKVPGRKGMSLGKLRFMFGRLVFVSLCGRV